MMRGGTLVSLGGKLVKMRLSTVCKTLFLYSFIQEITIQSHKVQNVVVILQQMIKGTLQVSGCTVCMDSWLLWWGFFFLSSKALNQNAQRASSGRWV